MSLTKTEHLGLNVFQQTQETTTLVRDVLRAIADDTTGSNMHILDQAVFDLQSNIKDVETHAEDKSNPHKVTAAQSGAVPTTRKVNGKELSTDVILTAKDVTAIPDSQKGAAGGVAELGDDGTVPSEQMPGYAVTSGMCTMGQSCPGGPIKVDNIRGDTILGGTPAYDAPVSMESVKGPLRLHMAGKNLVDMTLAADVTTAAVSCVVNAATGTLTLSGTCDRPDSAAFIFPFGSGRERGVFLPAGTYHLSGLPESYADNSVRIYVNLYNAKNQSVGSYITSDEGGISFSMEQGAWVTVNLRISDGTNVDGIVIRPQIEAGNQGTSYELPYSTTVEIPLLGTDGQELEPLRMAYGGNSSAKTVYYDRIVRRNGVWCVQRNTAARELTGAVWTVGSNYAFPSLNWKPIEDGVESYLPMCTHFPSRTSAGSGQDTGVWVGNRLVVGNQVLPNGAQTTAEELKSFCAAQAETGTPVTVIYALKNPVYEELHQDVQVILNTLCVPGGTCSVWFEGDILPSGADIGLPRGDYPCSGMEGAYRWLAELSSPLPIPTRDDLYAWALEQQRGGVFATDDGVTTKNVPESGALTGILSVTEQGTDVSMIAFGPTGKIHTATRIAGVWRGWTTLYSPLSKPNPADLGAAAASHGTHVSFSTTVPKVAGTAAVGTATTVARSDHVHPAQTTVSGNAGTATKLATARTIRTNLGSTSTASFDGSANVTPGITGTLPVANGGTGATTAAAARTALGVTPANIGALPLSGGTMTGDITMEGKAIICKLKDGAEAGTMIGGGIDPSSNPVLALAATNSGRPVRILNVASPIDINDATPKSYVDNTIREIIASEIGAINDILDTINGEVV